MTLQVRRDREAPAAVLALVRLLAGVRALVPDEVGAARENAVADAADVPILRLAAAAIAVRRLVAAVGLRAVLVHRCRQQWCSDRSGRDGGDWLVRD